jgi:hypothetical protein
MADLSQAVCVVCIRRSSALETRFHDVCAPAIRLRVFGSCPATPVMERIPTRAQVLAFPPRIQACCRDAGGQPCVGGPHMIGEACGHRWGHRAPRARRTDTSSGLRCRQRFLAPRVRKHQMVRGQRHPQPLRKPRQVLGEVRRATGQASVALALREMLAFDNTGVHRLPDRRGRHTRCHGLWLT